MLDLFQTGFGGLTWGSVVMFVIGGALIYLGIAKKMEPLLLVPIGFGVILVNLPFGGLMESVVNGNVVNSYAIGGEPAGVLARIFRYGLVWELIPVFIFLGLGAMTDFGPIIANPKTLLLGAGAQFGVYLAFFLALLLGFDIREAAPIGIIGGADGPTTIYLTNRLAPTFIGATAVAAYTYMALVPIIQPPIMKALTTPEERKIEMAQLRHVSAKEKVLFPLAVLFLTILFLPSATPLVGMFCFGNLMKECGVVDRLSKTAQNELINIVTIFLGLAVGSKLSADKFLTVETLGILGLGAIAFAIGTATGVIMAKIMSKASGGTINPLIGAAGVSAVPMAARVVNKVGLEANPHNFLLMHAMGPNVAGVLGSAVAAGVLLALVG